MRINKFLAQGSFLSRRKADSAVTAGRVLVNGQPASSGQDISTNDVVTLDGKVVTSAAKTTVLFHKPAGFVVSRDGQGSRTIYDLLPPEFQQLQHIGRLDKYSSGLLLMTNDGELANELTHPSRGKTKLYEVTLDKPLEPLHRQMISDHGIQLDDGPSKLQLERQNDGDDRDWIIRMHEGRNRQIRRTFAALDYKVVKLHRTQFGDYHLNDLKSGQVQSTATIKP